MVTRRFARTEKGQAEIAQRGKNLRGKLRTVLFFVEPGKPLDEIQRQAAQIGAPADALVQLMAGGYIAEISTGDAPAAAPLAAAGDIGDELECFRVAKAFMNDTIVDTLGIRAFGFTLKLERCATRADLAALLPGYTDALAKKLDRNAVLTLVERTREFLGASAR
jgi:hypothetical protein